MSAKHTFAIAPQAMVILHECTMTDTTVVLPAKQLPRSLYESVNDVLKEFGGIWNRGKKRHDFPIGGVAKLKAAMGTGEVKREKVIRQAFYTPDAVANELALFALLQGRERPKVLEPSCGDGALIRAVRHVCPSALVTACDIDKDAVEQARNNLGGDGQGAVVILCDDFLKQMPITKFDVVVANPPFQRGQAHSHIKHMLGFLKPKGVLAAIVPTNFDVRLAAADVKMNCNEQPIPAGAFKESGTMIATKMIRIMKS